MFRQAVGQLGKDDGAFNNYFNNPELGSYQIWDPATGQAVGLSQQIGGNLFCGGQVALADGTILVAGGQDGAGAAELTGQYDKYLDELLTGTDNGALKDLYTYDPVADSWSPWPDLADGRYYPTCQILGDGTAFIAGGLSNLAQWTFSGGTWAENDQFEKVLPGELPAGPTPQQKFMSADQYPVIRLLPGSRKLFVHVETKSYIFDLDSSSFVPGAQFMPPSTDAAGQPVGRQTYPMQTGHVLLPQKEGDPPRIMMVGGSTWTNFDYNAGAPILPDMVQNAPAILGAFIFEFDAATPTNSKWRMTKNPPTVARLLVDTVLLPDGTVFVVNGIKAGAAAGHSKDAVTTAEIFDPINETFTAVASSDPNHPRGYHATAILLPDGRVAVAGNTDAYNPGEPNHHDDVSIQIFTPPYLTNVPLQRPVVTGVPDSISYGSSLNLDTSGGPPVAMAMLMRPCAVTHSVDMDQRAIILGISGGAGTVTVTIPADHSLFPPGFYMLFFLAADNTPSNASWIRVFDAAPTFPPWNLGTYSGSGYMVIDEAFDGDLTIEKIDNGARVTLENRHGSITIKDKISDQDTYVNLKAATTVKIGNKIDQHAVVVIDAGGDVSIGQTIDQHSNATIKTKGNIEIGLKIDRSSGALLTADGSVHIGQKIDQHSNAVIQAKGDVTIDEKIGQWATADITAGGKLHIGQKIDQHARVTINATGDVTIGQKLDANSNSTITSSTGSVTVSQGMSDHASATITALQGFVTMDTIDGGCTLNWSAQGLNCSHPNGTINQI